jgi:periplasmic protein TonB
MFDKLIESNSAEAEFKPRRKFFMVSSVVVGIMFLSAVMISLYAQDLDLGTEEFELSAIMAPVPPDAPEPEPPRRQPESSTETADVQSRPEFIAQLDRNTEIPDAISTTPNKIRAIPDGPVSIGEDTGRDLQPNRAVGETPGTGVADSIETTETEVVKVPPPPAIVKAVPKKPVTQTKGVMNGYAINLPKPGYPPTAKAINLTGSVNVQVVIDESGDVVSARAIDGHMLFKRDAELAARRAKFKPTYLGDQPVRVTGVIIYNFTK